MKIKITILAILLIGLITNAQNKITNFTSPNSITSIAEDGNNIWIGTANGLFVRKRSTGAIILSYSTSNGLPSNSINKIFIDPFSNVWVGTSNGLAKFDGSSWETFDFSSDNTDANSDNIIDIRQDIAGAIWIIKKPYYSNTLLKKYENNLWTNYTVPEDIDLYCLEMANNGTIWLGAYNGIYTFDETTYNHISYLTDTSIVDIQEDINGDIWFGTSGYGLGYFDGTNYVTYTTNDGLITDYVHSIAFDSDNNIWLAGYDGVTKFDPEDIDTETFGEAEGIYKYANYINIDSDGYAWIGTDYGLNKYDPSTSEWNKFLDNNSIPTNWVYDLALDQNDDLWVATEVGLSKYNNNNWTNYFIEDGLPESWALCLTADNNNHIWITFGSSLSYFDGSTFTNYSTPFSTPTDIVANTDGSIWISTEGYGLYHFDGTNFTQYTTADGLIDDYTISLFKDSNNKLWIGGYDGLSVWDGSSFTNYTTANGLSDNTTSQIYENSNNQILAVSSYDISVLNGNTWENFNSGYYNDKFVYTRDIKEDSDGYYWIASDEGLIKENGTNHAIYTETDGMSSKTTSQIEISTNNTKWLNTGSSGIIRIECKAPIPSFTTNITCLPSSTIFTNTSTEIDATTEYEWDINNDGTVEYTTAEIIHSFTTEGNHPVKLTTNNGSCSASTIINVLVKETPVITLTPSEDIYICDGSSASIEIQTGGDVTTTNSIFIENCDNMENWSTQGLGATNWVLSNTNYAGGTANELFFTYDPQFDGESRIVSPVINTSEYSSLELHFKHIVDWDYDSPTIGVKTSTNGSTWHTVWSQNITDDIAANTHSISINNSDVGSPNFQIAFFYTGDSYNLNAWAIDDILLEGSHTASTGSSSANYTYEWSTGSSSNSINISTENSYSVTATNGACTYIPDPVELFIVYPILPSICMVTVDTEVNKNLIVWEKPITESIASYNIYKEISTDNYQIIGSKAYSDLSEITDYTSTPSEHADKYKISVIDTCGNESELSPFHQTINLSQALGAQEDEIVLMWNKYIDESGNYIPDNYLVYRGIDDASMTLASSLTGSLSTFTYNAPDVIDNEKFIVIIDIPGCTPTSDTKASGGPYYQSTSNIEDEGIIDTKMSTIDPNFDITLYPNPNNGEFIVGFSQAVSGEIQIMDMSGRILLDETLNNKAKWYNNKILETGIYLVKINLPKEGLQIIKIVVE